MTLTDDAKIALAEEIANLSNLVSNSSIENEINEATLKAMDFLFKNILDNPQLSENDKLDKIININTSFVLLKKKVEEFHHDLKLSISSIYSKLKIDDSNLQISSNPVNITPQGEEKILPQTQQENSISPEVMAKHLILNDNQITLANMIFSASSSNKVRSVNLNREFFHDQAIGTFIIMESIHVRSVHRSINYMCIKGKSNTVFMIQLKKKDLQIETYLNEIRKLKQDGLI